MQKLQSRQITIIDNLILLLKFSYELNSALQLDRIKIIKNFLSKCTSVILSYIIIYQRKNLDPERRVHNDKNIGQILMFLI